MSQQDRIVIVGAGIGGLTAGLCLERAGFSVQLVERFDEVREVGAGILLAPNASNVHYNRLDLGDQLDAVSAPLLRGSVENIQGKVLANLVSIDVDQLPAPPRMIHRAALQRVLYDGLGADRVRLSSAVTGFKLGDGGVAAVTEDGDSIWGRALIGADGVNSKIRAQLVGDEPDPLRYHGYTCWRGITGPFEHPDFAFGTLKEIQGRGARAGMGYIDDERVYWWATADAPRGERDDRETIHTDLATIYADFPDHFLAMIEATDTDKILRNDICDRPPLRRWGTGPITLLGDAAHPMSPNLGQGACSAVEDADMLAICLANYDDLPQGLRRYAQLRQKRTAQLQKKSKQFGDIGQWKNPVAVKARELSTALLTPLVMDKQQRWLWDYDAKRAFLEVES